MSDPGAALQKAIYDQLRVDAGVTALVAGRIFDAVPKGALPDFPYISFGTYQANEDGAGCIDGTEAYIDLHVWSRAVGSLEAKRIASAVRAALHEADMSLAPDHRLIEIMFDGNRVLSDPDGLTTHGVLTFRALTETAV